MPNELATINQETALAEARYGMTRDQVELLKRTIAKGCTDDELQLFGQTAKRLGLDPFAKQIYAIKRRTKDGEVLTLITGIDGYRLIAHRTGQLEGIEGPAWCGPDGQWLEVWLDRKSPPAAAKCVVYRRGCARPFVGIVTWHEYVQLSNPQWTTRGPHMLGKCSEAAALRKAFPAELSGVNVPEEIDQGESEVFERPEATPPKAKAAKAISPPAQHAPAAVSVPATTTPPPYGTLPNSSVARLSPAQEADIERQRQAIIAHAERSPEHEGNQQGTAPEARADYEASAARVAAERRTQPVIDVEVAEASADDFGAEAGEPGVPAEMTAFRAALAAARTPEDLKQVRAKFVPLSAPGGVLNPYAGAMRTEFVARDAQIPKGG